MKSKRQHSVYNRLVYTIPAITSGIFLIVFGVYFLMSARSLNKQNTDNTWFKMRFEKMNIDQIYLDSPHLFDIIDGQPHKKLMSWFESSIQRIKQTNETIDAFLVDSADVYCLYDDIDDSATFDLLDEVKARQDYIRQHPQSRLEIRFVNIFCMPVASSDLVLVIITHDWDFIKALTWLSQAAVGLFLAFMLILFFLLRKISRGITNPVNKLIRSSEEISKGDFHSELPKDSSFREINSLRDSFSKMQSSLITYISNLRSTTIAKEKIQSELDIAHNIQMGMLPSPIEGTIGSLHGGFHLSAFLRPAKEVGGDIYDHVLIDGFLYLLISDVSGKGVPASLLASSIQSLFRADATRGCLPSETVLSINGVLCRNNTTNMFATIFVARVDTETGLMTYCNAGHNPPYIVLASGGVQKVPAHGDFPAGIFEAAEYTDMSIVLDGKLVLYTDGVVEAESVDHELYGEKRFESLLSASAGEQPVVIISDTVSAVEGHTKGAAQSDDITIMIIG